jgi:hypothetical protein
VPNVVFCVNDIKDELTSFHTNNDVKGHLLSQIYILTVGFMPKPMSCGKNGVTQLLFIFNGII